MDAEHIPAEAPTSDTEAPSVPDQDELRTMLENLPVSVQKLIQLDVESGRGRIATDPQYFEERPHRLRGELVKRPNNRFKWRPTEREQIKAECTVLDSMGYTQHQIARKLEIDQGSVSKFLREARDDFNKTIVEVRQDMAVRELHTLLQVRQMAYEALERAEDGVNSTESGVGEKGGHVHMERHTEVLPPAEYLNIILKTNQRLCQMFGLDEAAQATINISTTNNTLVTGAAMLEAIVQHANRPSKLSQLEAAERDHAAGRVNVPVA